MQPTRSESENGIGERKNASECLRGTIIQSGDNCDSSTPDLEPMIVQFPVQEALPRIASKTQDRR